MGSRRDPNARWWRDMDLYQKQALEFAIDYCGGVNRAAAYLGLNHGYVYRLAKKFGITTTIRDYNKQDETHWGKTSDEPEPEDEEPEPEDEEPEPEVKAAPKRRPQRGLRNVPAVVPAADDGELVRFFVEDD